MGGKETKNEDLRLARFWMAILNVLASFQAGTPILQP